MTDRFQMAPPDALAELADAMIRAGPLDHVDLQRELEGIEPEFRAPDEWRLPGRELCDKIKAVMGIWPPSVPDNVGQFVRYVVALQHLDRWHRPLLPTEMRLPRLEEHELLLDKIAIEGRLNDNPDKGIVVGRLAPGERYFRLENEGIDWNGKPSHYEIVLSLLENCLFLPAKVGAGDPDDENFTLVRQIDLTFQRILPEDYSFTRHHNELRMAFAPVAETTDDAEIWVDGDKYSISSRVSFERFENIIKKSLSCNAEILLLPEMSLSYKFLEDFRGAVRSMRKIAVQSNSDAISALRLIFVGVIKEPDFFGGKHRNFVVAINGMGDVLFSQEKLSHWNLNERAMSRFGLDNIGYASPLYENTEPGSEIKIIEISGLGRLVTLICADMSHDMPGDWILDNIGLDWLFAPIMDGSTCWTQGALPWIVKRALRATKMSGTTAVVSNSMVMTHWNNKTIASKIGDSTYPYKIYDSCGIGFVSRQQDAEIVVKHVTVSLNSITSPVLRIIEWSSTWSTCPIFNGAAGVGSRPL